MITGQLLLCIADRDPLFPVQVEVHRGTRVQALVAYGQIVPVVLLMRFNPAHQTHEAANKITSLPDQAAGLLIQAVQDGCVRHGLRIRQASRSHILPLRSGCTWQQSHDAAYRLGRATGVSLEHCGAAQYGLFSPIRTPHDPRAPDVLHVGAHHTPARGGFVALPDPLTPQLSAALHLQTYLLALTRNERP